MKEGYKKNRIKKITIFVLIVLLSSYILYLYTKKIVILYKKNTQLQLLNYRILELENKELELKKKIKNLKNFDEIEKEARKLGLVKEGEKSFKIFTIKKKSRYTSYE